MSVPKYQIGDLIFIRLTLLDCEKSHAVIVRDVIAGRRGYRGKLIETKYRIGECDEWLPESWVENATDPNALLKDLL